MSRTTVTAIGTPVRSGSRARTISGMLVAVAAAAAVLSACGGAVDGSAAPAGSPGGAAPAAATDESQIEAAFRGYYDAIRDRDYETACSFDTPEAIDFALSSMKAVGISATTCAEALEKTQEMGNNAETLDTVAKTAEVQKVVVTGDTAAVTWSAELDGERQSTTTAFRRVDGQWRMDYTGG